MTFKHKDLRTKGSKLGLAAESRDTSRERPVFSLKHLIGNYCIPTCNQEQKAAFADTLYNLSRLSWVEIMQQSKHGLGCEKIPRYRIRRPIPAHITDDITLLAFRFWKKAPMVGYRMEETFHIVWLDKDFDLYPHE
jgi:hypothetical protein